MKKMLAVLAAATMFATLGADPPSALAQAPATASTPAWEAVLRQTIDQLAQGKPDYDRMVPPLADAAKQQQSQVEQLFMQFGKLTAVKFDRTDENGIEWYNVTFEHGVTQWGIKVEPDGKISALGVRPAS